MRLCGEKGTDDGGEGEDVAEQFCFVLRDARCTSFEAVGSAGAGVLMNSINLNDINTKLSLEWYHFPIRLHRHQGKLHSFSYILEGNRYL
jgi:hypothetical protein